MQTPSFWENQDGSWSLGLLLARELCRCERFTHSINPEELYYILSELNLLRKLADYWDNTEFYKRAGAAGIGLLKSTSSPNNGRSAQRGDQAWSMGDLKSAEDFFADEMNKLRESGFNGMFRLRFAQERFDECISIFKNTCPNAHLSFSEFFQNKTIDVASPKSTGFTSADFITPGVRMLQVVVFAGVHSSHWSDELEGKILRYFASNESELEKLKSTYGGSFDEFERLAKRVSPKAVSRNNSLESLAQQGRTDRAIKIKTTIENYRTVTEHLKGVLQLFVQTGDDSDLKTLVQENSPFGYDEMDSIVYEAALADIKLEELELQSVLSLLRIFGKDTNFPSSGCDLNGRRWNNWGISFTSELSRCIHGLQAQLTPKDLFAVIKNDCRVPRCMIADTSWCCSILTSFLSENYDSSKFSSESSLLEFAQKAYLHIEEKIIEARSKNRWVSEEMLTTAIKSLFGKEFVEPHATPAWLSPQHLDIYLPKYRLAIEYMGLQHYEPVDFFGGQSAFEKTLKRDNRKKELCSKAGITLVYVTHKDEIGKSALKIWDQYKNDFKPLTS